MSRAIGKDFFLLLLVVGMIFVPAYFAGLSVSVIEILIIFYILLLVYFISLNYFGYQLYINRISSVILSTLLFWIVVQMVLFSRVPYSSFRELILFASGALFYLAGVNIEHQRWLPKVIVLGSVILVVLGLVYLMESKDYGYLRLTSTFGQHNAFAGFLILPLMLSLWWFFEKKPYGYIVTALFVVLIGMGIFLTFSRGGFISAGVAILIFVYFLWQQSVGAKQFIFRVILLVGLLAIACGVGYVVLDMKKERGLKENAKIAFSPYGHERPGETGIRARIEYAKYAMRLFTERPIVGHGFGSFAYASRRIQQDIRFFSVDPHNLYLRIFAELGLIGGISWILFLLSIVVPAFLCIKNGKIDFLTYAYMAGFVGIIVHNMVELDFRFPANITLLFLAAGVVGRGTAKNIQFARNARWLYVIILSILLILLLFVSIGSYFFARALAALARDDISSFEKNFKLGSRFDPINPLIRVKIAEFELHKGMLGEAEQMLKHIGRFYPNQRDLFLLRGSLYHLRGDLSMAEVDYNKAIDAAPYRDLEAAAGLVDIYKKMGRKDELRALIDEQLKRFSLEHLRSNLWTYPDKPRILEQRRYLENLLAELDRENK